MNFLFFGGMLEGEMVSGARGYLAPTILSSGSKYGIAGSLPSGSRKGMSMGLPRIGSWYWSSGGGLKKDMFGGLGNLSFFTTGVFRRKEEVSSYLSFDKSGGRLSSSLGLDVARGSWCSWGGLKCVCWFVWN